MAKKNFLWQELCKHKKNHRNGKAQMFQILIKYIFENILLDWLSKKVVVLNGGMIRILTVKLIILFSAIEVEKFFFDEKYMPSFKKSA